MYQRICWTHILVLCLATSFVSCSVQAQDAILSQYYGNGVHEFHSGDFVKAFEYLSKPIDAKTEDPRPYYYRGLALIKMGRPDQAAKDFKSGAEQELKDTTGRYRIDFALERCQGPSRLTLEKMRLDARLAALQRKARMTQSLSGSGMDGSVLLDDTALTPGDFSGGLELEEGLDDTAIVDDGSELGIDEEEPATEEPAVEDEDSELGIDEEEPAAEGDDSGLGFGEEEPATEEPAFEEPAAEGDDSGLGFGEEEPAAEEPAAEPDDSGLGFGEEEPAVEEPAAEGDNPFANETPDETDDANPFSGADLSDEEPAAEEPAAEEPAAEEPAAEEPAAEEPAAEEPAAEEPAAEEPAAEEPAAEEPAAEEPAAEEEDPFGF